MAAAQEIDIGDGSKDIENDQEDLPAGHSVQDDIVQNNKTGEELFFERTFDFNCTEMPTSFHLWVSFTLPHATALSSQAVVRRLDEGDGTVDVRLETKIFHLGHCEATLRHALNALKSFGEERETIQASISEETALAFREEGNLRFEFVLTVQGCHGEKEESESTTDTSSLTTSSEDSSPRKRLRV